MRGGAEELLFASTSSVYGASKAVFESLIYTYSKLYGIRAVVLRYANVVGPRLRHGVVYDLLMKLKRDRTWLEVLGDGTQVRSYVYIDDAIGATMVAYEGAGEGFSVFNVASEDWITVRDVVQIILGELSIEGIEVVYKARASRGRLAGGRQEGSAQDRQAEGLGLQADYEQQGSRG